MEAKRVAKSVLHCDDKDCPHPLIRPGSGYFITSGGHLFCEECAQKDHDRTTGA